MLDEGKTALAMENPQHGDRFTEMLSLWVYVIGRIGDKVITLEANAPCTLPEGGKVKSYNSVAEFRQRFAYGSRAGYWIRLVDRGNDFSEWLGMDVKTDIHTLRSTLWLARQAMATHDVPDAGARSAVDAALLATGGLEVNDTPAALAANYQEE